MKLVTHDLIFLSNNELAGIAQETVITQPMTLYRPQFMHINDTLFTVSEKTPIKLCLNRLSNKSGYADLFNAIFMMQPNLKIINKKRSYKSEETASHTLSKLSPQKLNHTLTIRRVICRCKISVEIKFNASAIYSFTFTTTTLPRHVIILKARGTQRLLRRNLFGEQMMFYL